MRPISALARAGNLCHVFEPHRCGQPAPLAANHFPLMAKIYNDITETIGNTPLVRLNRTAAAHGAQAEILLKLEFLIRFRPSRTASAKR